MVGAHRMAADPSPGIGPIGVADRKNTFALINLVRFSAAAWVLLFHANIHFGAQTAFEPANALLRHGPVAMVLFFTLSGFILTYRYTSLSSPDQYAGYIAARVARLYPVYLFMGVITAYRLGEHGGDFVLYEIAPVVWVVFVVVLFLLMLQAWVPSLFVVWNFGGSWSLSVEAFFYTCFPFLRSHFDGRNTMALLFYLAAATVLLTFVCVTVQMQVGERSMHIMYYVLPILRLFEFATGMLVFMLLVERQVDRRLFGILAIALASLAFAIMSVTDLPGLIDVNFLLSMPFAVGFTYLSEISVPASLEGPLNYLGHISYCLYMVQFGTIELFKTVIPFESPGARWAAFVAASIGAAMVLYHLVEKPSYGFVRRRLGTALRDPLAKLSTALKTPSADAGRTVP